MNAFKIGDYIRAELFAGNGEPEGYILGTVFKIVGIAIDVKMEEGDGPYYRKGGNLGLHSGFDKISLVALEND